MTITLNRPARMNALSGAMLVRMYDAFVAASTDDDVRCIILTGAGGNFCSGADLKAMAGDAEGSDPEIDVAARMAADPELHWKALAADLPPTKPIIAAVEGVAIAGGTEILQATEIRVAGESARFGVSRRAWSLYPMAGSAVRPPPADPVHARRGDPPHRQAPERARGARDRPRRTRRARRAGAREGARDRGRRVRERSARVEAIVRTLHETDGLPEAAALAHEFEYGWKVFQSEDAREGPRAFKEKRKPVFRRR
jgi:enoyl-CoA hydratase